MQKIPYIVTAVLILLTALFAILKTYWTGFVYFVLTCLFLLACFWGAWQIFRYFTEFKAEKEERFKYFKAQKINSSNVTSEIFESNLAVYKKEFNKKLLKDKLIKWFVILFCFAVAVAFLMGMVLYK